MAAIIAKMIDEDLRQKEKKNKIELIKWEKENLMFCLLRLKILER